MTVTWILRVKGREREYKALTLTQVLQRVSDKGNRSENPLEMVEVAQDFPWTNDKVWKPPDKAWLVIIYIITVGPLGWTTSLWQMKTFHLQLWAPHWGVSQPKWRSMTQHFADPLPNCCMWIPCFSMTVGTCHHPPRPQKSWWTWTWWNSFCYNMKVFWKSKNTVHKCKDLWNKEKQLFHLSRSFNFSK